MRTFPSSEAEHGSDRASVMGNRYVGPKQHSLGTTCVVIFARNPRMVAALCGAGNYNTRHSAQRTSAQPPRRSTYVAQRGGNKLQLTILFRLGVSAYYAQHIPQGDRLSSASNRVEGFVGPRTHGPTGCLQLRRSAHSTR